MRYQSAIFFYYRIIHSTSVLPDFQFPWPRLRLKEMANLSFKFRLLVEFLFAKALFLEILTEVEMKHVRGITSVGLLFPSQFTNQNPLLKYVMLGLFFRRQLSGLVLLMRKWSTCAKCQPNGKKNRQRSSSSNTFLFFKWRPVFSSQAQFYWVLKLFIKCS